MDSAEYSSFHWESEKFDLSVMLCEKSKGSTKSVGCGLWRASDSVRGAVDLKSLCSVNLAGFTDFQNGKSCQNLFLP